MEKSLSLSSSRLSRILWAHLVILAVTAPAILAQSQARLGWDSNEEARSHSTDIQKVELHISFDIPKKRVIGRCLTTLAPLPGPQPFTEFSFDQQGLLISRVWLQDGKQKTALQFDTVSPGKLHIELPTAIPFGRSIVVGVDYSASPKKGLYFREPDAAAPSRPFQIWTQGEGEDNHYWFPTYDFPNDKTTSEVYVTIDPKYKAISNGKFLGTKKEKVGTTWHYVMDQKHSTYLIMLAVGDFAVVEDKWHGKPVQYWLYPQWGKEGHRLFGQTPDMMTFFSTYTGIDYPWAKYAQIALADFMYGGMENTTATTLNDYVFFDAVDSLDMSNQGLIAHELAHQWFGDYVTCRSWIHLWLNESFATYMEALYNEYHAGHDDFTFEMRGAQIGSLSAESFFGKKPIVAADNYAANQYGRGASVLHMLRHIVGDTAFRAAINYYLTKHAYGNVTTEDLKMSFEEATGQNLAWFFDQWLYKAGHPKFAVSYVYDDSAKLVRLKVDQTQSIDSLTGYFRVPVDIELGYATDHKVERIVVQADSSQTFTLVSAERPAYVVFDRGDYLLAETSFERPVNELLSAARNASETINRADAITNLGKVAPNEEVRAALSEFVESPNPYIAQNGLNAAASGGYALPTVAVVKLIKTRKEPVVRAPALNYLASFGSKDTAMMLLESAINATENPFSAPSVRAVALELLEKLDSARAVRYAYQFMGLNSGRDRLRQAAIRVLGNNASAEAVAAIAGYLRTTDQNMWTQRVALETLGDVAVRDSLMWHPDKQSRTLDVLWTFANSKVDKLRRGALGKIADAGDAKTLERLRAMPMQEDSPEFRNALLDRMEKRLNGQSSRQLNSH